MSEPLFDGWTKATTAEGEQLNYGPNWITGCPVLKAGRAPKLKVLVPLSLNVFWRWLETRWAVAMGTRMISS